MAKTCLSLGMKSFSVFILRNTIALERTSDSGLINNHSYYIMGRRCVCSILAAKGVSTSWVLAVFPTSGPVSCAKKLPYTVTTAEGLQPVPLSWSLGAFC